MILRFSSGSLDPGQRVEEPLLGVDDVQGDPGGGDEVALDLLGLALAQQAVVDEHAVEPVADRALHDGRGDGGVHAAGEPADRPAGVADLGADPLDLLLDDVDHRPGLPAAGDVVQEVLEHPLAVLGVQHLGMPLHPGQPPVEVLEGRDRGGLGGGEHREPSGCRGDRVAVGHPDLVRRRARRPAARRASATVTWVRPYSRPPVCATSPPRPCAISWKP